MIREAAKNLNAEKFYQIFAMVVAKKEYKDIMDMKEKDVNKRLKTPTKEEQIEMMKKMNPDIMKDLMTLFHQMNKYTLAFAYVD